jgi:hypothetical protein
MASIPQIRDRLLEEFTEKQADLLACVVIEAHDDLANRAVFHALTGVVKELADTQKEPPIRNETRKPPSTISRRCSRKC